MSREKTRYSQGRWTQRRERTEKCRRTCQHVRLDHRGEITPSALLAHPRDHAKLARILSYVPPSDRLREKGTKWNTNDVCQSLCVRDLTLLPLLPWHHSPNNLVNCPVPSVLTLVKNFFQPKNVYKPTRSKRIFLYTYFFLSPTKASVRIDKKNKLQEVYRIV